MVPVKPLVLSRMCSISRKIDGSERLWMMRPSCSVIEQKVQPPKQPRMMFTEKRIISHAGIFIAIGRMRRARVGQAVDMIHFGGAERQRRRIEPDVALAVLLHQRPGIARIRLEVEG